MRLLVGDAVTCEAMITAGAVMPIGSKSSKRKVDSVVSDDFYDGIKRLYAEDGASTADVATASTCAGEVLRCPGALQLRDLVARVNN